MIETKQTMKIHAFLAKAGIASRRKAEELVADGKVEVNGQTAQVGQRVVLHKDVVSLEGKKISLEEPVTTYLIYKPVGYVSSTQDELHRKTVMDFLKENLPKDTVLPRLYPVGRLDLESEGLMILTNDGEFTQRFTHPSFEVPKTYRISVDGQPTEKALRHLEKGVMLKEGLTAPAQVEVISTEPSSSVLEITIHEGRNQQVRRMLRRVGYEVTRLIRVKMGEYTVEDLEGKPIHALKVT
jgi:23S rRNA pseudouridine2605 synthase